MRAAGWEKWRVYDGTKWTSGFRRSLSAAPALPDVVPAPEPFDLEACYALRERLDKLEARPVNEAMPREWL